MAVVVVAAALVVAFCVWSQRPATTSRAHIDPRWPGWGFTHTQFSADTGDPQNVADAEEAIKNVPVIQAQAIMGWGVDNPEPAPGRYDFESLDRRMAFIRASGGMPVIVLCCSPDWMRGGQPGETDWTHLEDAPSADHFKDFATLSATIAKRYPYVRHFLVWNEFKGFYDDNRHRWDAQAYTTLYNSVYRAVKAVDPANQIGGPYLDFTTKQLDTNSDSSQLQGPWGSVDEQAAQAFEYWNMNRAGADFVAVDAHATSANTGSDEFGALQQFAAVNEWLRMRINVPIWWPEWYVSQGTADWTSDHRIALRVAAMIELATSGADTILYWNPRPSGATCAECLWTDTWDPGGGQALPLLRILQLFARWFPPNSPRHKVFVAEGLMAMVNDTGAKVIVNTTNRTVKAVVDGRTMQWSAYQVHWLTPQQRTQAR